MTMVTRVVVVLVLLGSLAAGALPATAQGTQFSLAVGQSATAGPYTIVFRGSIEQRPVYDLYVGSVFAARFPSSGPAANPGDRYANDKVGIVTRTVAPDGSAVTGTLTVK
jgi:hypothetical protein